jgi:hypothetical protein
MTSTSHDQEKPTQNEKEAPHGWKFDTMDRGYGT